jgi:hypothetical protein
MSEDRVDLSHLDEEYAETEVPEQEFSPIPDGKYQVLVERAEIATAQTSGNPMLKWTLRILGPAFRDRLLWKNSVLLSGLLQYVKKDLQTCGVHIQKISDLPDQLEKLLDIRLEIVKKTKNESESIYFNKLISRAAEDNYERASQEAKTPF